MSNPKNKNSFKGPKIAIIKQRFKYGNIEIYVPRNCNDFLGGHNVYLNGKVVPFKISKHLANTIELESTQKEIIDILVRNGFIRHIR